MSLLDDGPRARILEENIHVHAIEATHYDDIHIEIFCPQAQRRLSKVLVELVAAVPNASERTALDVGAGTGNVTLKLLALGFRVVALDVSAAMLSVLGDKAAQYMKQGRLSLTKGTLDQLEGGGETFAVVAAYSVLHHLPDYVQGLHQMASLVEPGGVLYVDHEAAPARHDQPAAYKLYRWMLNRYRNGLRKLRSVIHAEGRTSNLQIDYSWSDYWIDTDHHIDWHWALEELRSTGMEVQVTDYLAPCDPGGLVPWPLHVAFRGIVADTRMLVARKTQ